MQLVFRHPAPSDPKLFLRPPLHHEKYTSITSIENSFKFILTRKMMGIYARSLFEMIKKDKFASGSSSHFVFLPELHGNWLLFTIHREIGAHLQRVPAITTVYSDETPFTFFFFFFFFFFF